MPPAIVQEYGSIALESLLAEGLEPEHAALWEDRILHQSSGLARQLGLRARPFGLERGDDGMMLTVGGVIGSAQLAGRELRIAPKFVPRDRWDEPWELAVLQMVSRATGRRWTTARSARVAPGSANFLDHVARAFAEAVDRAMRSDPIRSWQSFEEEHAVLRGRLMVSRQLRSLFSRPGVVHCEVDRLHADNPLNHLLHWAALRFRALARDGTTRRMLAASAAWLPRVEPPVRLPAQLPSHLPPQYAHWDEAIQLASLLARNLGQHPGAGEDPGHAMLVDSADLYEGFLERSLMQAIPAWGEGWSMEAQVQRTFATPLLRTRKSFATKPDDVLYRDGEAVLLIDAKYKRLSDADHQHLEKPSNADIYQLAASAVAHDCPRGLLVYPKVVGDELSDAELRCWKVDLPGQQHHVLLGAIAVDLMKLTEEDGLASFDRHLLAQLQKMLDAQAGDGQ
jgi:5-methylcytosine-specific restriction enzyme subunit McrC